MAETIPARILHTQGCPNLIPTIDRIEKVGRGPGPAVAMERVLVSSQQFPPPSTNRLFTVNLFSVQFDDHFR